jgi:hypothetical protein
MDLFDFMRGLCLKHGKTLHHVILVISSYMRMFLNTQYVVRSYIVIRADNVRKYDSIVYI